MAVRARLPPRRFAPGALKRVQQYVEDHLAERVSTERLAAIAGLSVFHFVQAVAKHDAAQLSRMCNALPVPRAIQFRRKKWVASPRSIWFLAASET